MDTVETLVAERLVLRKPTPADARDLFDRYASDPVVTRYLAWPRHESIDDTVAFLRCSEEAWSAQQVGPYVILDRDQTVLGTTGLDIETPQRAATGYVLARDAAGRGYATEAAKAMTRLADTLHIRRLYALCHPEITKSVQVLRKAGFEFEGVLRRHTVFPNLGRADPQDVECWARLG